MTWTRGGPIVPGVTSSGGRPHGPAVLAWHGLCALGMAAMVLPVPPWVPRAAFVLFVAGVLWCGVRARRGGGERAAYLGLGLCCLAMVVMLVPALDWVVANPAAGVAVTPVGHAAMRMSSAAGVPTAHASVPTVLLAVLALALAVLCLRGMVRSAASVGRRSRTIGLEGGRRGVLGGVLEALLAGAMAAMLVAGS